MLQRLKEIEIDLAANNVVLSDGEPAYWVIDRVCERFRRLDQQLMEKKQ